MADTFGKKALQQKRAKKQIDKLERREERKTNNNKGKSLEEMIVYLDENGNLTDVHPDKQQKKKVNHKDATGASNMPIDNKEYFGTISLFFHDKGYGFITEDQSKETVFVHANKLREQIEEKDKVSYNKEQTPKGFAAINVKKIK